MTSPGCCGSEAVRSGGAAIRKYLAEASTAKRTLEDKGRVVALVLLLPDNQSKDKHVESKLIPRLTRVRNLSSPTKKVASRCLFRFQAKVNGILD